MINVTDSIKKAYEESTTQYDKIVLYGQEYEINNVQYEDDCYYEGNIFGTAIARTLDFEIENIIDLENKEFEYLTGIKTENGIEWISLGNFITQEVEPNDTTGVNKVNAMDYMLKSNITYESNLDYESGTVTMLQVLQEACQKAGIELATTDFANANFIVDSNQFDENSLIRQVFQAVAQISGTFAKVRFDNKLYFKTPKRQGLKVKDVNKMLVKDLNALPVYKLSLANFKMKLNDYSELILKRNTHPINLVSLGMSDVEGENVVLRDEESITEDGENSLVINDNPFAYTQSKREQLITALFDVVKGFEYTSFEIAGQAKPYQETGDEVAVINSDGTYSSSFLFRFNYKSPNGLESEMSAPSITKATVNYQNVATAEQISKRTELRVDKQEQKILGIIEQQTETGNKLTQVEQTVDGITQTVSSVETKVETVENKAEQAQTSADNAQSTADEAISKITTTTNKVSEIEQTVDNITSTVSSVETKVEQVENKADIANSNAQKAQSSADTAQSTAENAQNTADNATKQITTTNQKVSQIDQTVSGITQSVSAVEEKVETVETKADNAQSSANNAQSTANTANQNAQNAQTTADNINNNLTQNYYTKTETNSQIQQTADTINQTVQQTIDKTNKISGEVEQQSSKLTEIEQSLDGISQRVETIQDLTQTVEGAKTITLANCVEGNLLELYIYGNNDVFKYLYPSNDLYPSDTLYPYGDSRLVVTDENNNSTTYELGVTDVLRQNGNVCDEYRLEGGKAKVIRRINKDGTVKSKETTENLGEYFIRLKNGTNKISIKNYTATVKAKYAIQNDYTEIFSTKVETKTAIEQTAEDIDISVNKKLESYSTTTEMNSAINLKANEINQKVEKKVDEETITGAYLVLKINEDKSESKLNADKIDISANDVLNILSGNTINLKTKNIKIESNNFSVDENGNIVAKSGTIGGWTVNSEAIFNGKGLGQEGSVGISCKIDDWAFWAGNGVFKVSPSGALTATNATITGKITASSGSIGGAQINNQGLYFNNDSESTGWGLWGTTANANIVMHAGAKSNNIGGAPFKIYHDGSVYMSKGQISGNLITSGINANNITGGSLSMSRISGGTLNVGSNGGYLRVGVGYTHPEVSGLNVGDNGININSGRLIITSGGNWSYIRSSYGLDNIRLLDSSGSNIPCGGSDYMSFMDIAMVVKYCREHGYSSSI